MRVFAYDIDWDTDGDTVNNLPLSCEVVLDDDADPQYDLADVLSDEYGFCINSLSFRMLDT